ncbi:hypothetical protein [Amycolatopsis pigmentata]|uniref:Serine/threonine protein kinase n=1 Tax=Amycolatopsis pigmentata TaxID=450801 RepID=A0ABW5FR62_9PSEU
MKEGRTDPARGTDAGESRADAEKADAEAPTRLMRILDGAEPPNSPDSDSTDPGTKISKAPETSGPESPTRFLPAVKAKPEGDTGAVKSTAPKPDAESPTRLLPAVAADVSVAKADAKPKADARADAGKGKSDRQVPTWFLPKRDKGDTDVHPKVPDKNEKEPENTGKLETEADKGEGPTQFLPAVKPKPEGDTGAVKSTAPKPDAESPTRLLPAVAADVSVAKADAKPKADARADAGKGKPDRQVPTWFLPKTDKGDTDVHPKVPDKNEKEPENTGKPETEADKGEAPTQFLPAVKPKPEADTGAAKSAPPKPDSEAPTQFLPAVTGKASDPKPHDGKPETEAAKANMDAPTRFLRALTGNRPVRRFAGPNRPMHYDAPPDGPPTRYIPAAGRVARLAAPPALTEPAPEAPPARDAAKPPGRAAVAGSGLLTDPFFGPGMAGVAIILWIVGLHPIAPEQIGGAGIVAELSIPLLLSFPLLVGAVVLELLRYQPRNWVLGVYTTLGVLGVYGLQPAVEQVARLPVAWLHVGFSGYIADHGDILHNYDARFSWAGFFSLIALITKAAGIPSAVPLLNWAPTVLSGMSVLGVRALAVSALGNRRASWIAPWLFLAANWTEQDYFSPQGTAMVMLLAALTLTFRHLVRPRLTEPVRARLRARLAPRSSPKARLVAQGAVVLIGLALAVTHQLTPFLLGALLLLVLVFGRLWPAWLPFVVFGAAVVWFSLGASEFWSGQLIQMILSPLGDISSSVDQGIVDRFTGDVGHLVVLLTRVVISVFMVALAAVGIVFMRRDSLRSWLLPVLCVAPFGIAVAQPYGGEVFMRCFLFALPLLALPASIALERSATAARRWRWRNQPGRTIALAAVPWLVVTGLIATTITARGGNDAYTSFTKSDVTAASWAIQQAQDGQRVDALVNSVPLSFSRVGEVQQYEVDGYCPKLDSLSELVGCVRTNGPDYLVLSGPQFAYLRIFDQVPYDFGGQFIKELTETGLYRGVFIDGDATVLARTAPALDRPAGDGSAG